MKRIVVAKKADFLKWALLLFLLLGALAANTYYARVDWGIRAACFLAVLPLFGWILSLTSQGWWAYVFFKHSAAELKRVVWPKRQEALRMTFLVMLAVMVVSLLLWGLDTFFLWIVKELSSPRL